MSASLAARALPPIESGIPFPGRADVSVVRERCELLGVGQSFAIPAPGRADAADAKMAAHSYGRAVGKRFRTGRCPINPANYRIWRIK